MIKHKTKFLIVSSYSENYELGQKLGLFQWKDDSGTKLPNGTEVGDGRDDQTGKTYVEYSNGNGFGTAGPQSGIEKAKSEGNQDAKILAAVYEQFVSDKSLTRQEIEKLEYLDSALGGADIAVNPITGNASILQNDDAKTFNLEFPGKGRKR